MEAAREHELPVCNQKEIIISPLTDSPVSDALQLNIGDEHNDDVMITDDIGHDEIMITDYAEPDVVSPKSDGERPWVCNICDFAFKYKNNMHEHLRFYHMKGQVPCNHCSQVFPSSNILRKHMQEHSLLAGRCPHCRTALCDGKPVDQMSYEMHIEYCARKPKSKKIEWKDLIAKEYQPLSSTTQLPSEKVVYELVSIVSENDTLTCGDDKETADLQFGMPDNEPFNYNAEKLVGGNCQNQDENESADLIEIIDEVKEDEPELLNDDCTIMYVCKYCSKCFTEIEEKRKHKAQCTGGNKANDILNLEKENVVLVWVCKYCNRNFSKNELLQTHKLNCIEKKKRHAFFNCSKCHFTFSSMSVLKMHMQVCKKQTPSVDNAERRADHIQNKTRIWTCYFCRKSFQHKRNFMIHKQVCKKNGSSEDSRKLFVRTNWKCAISSEKYPKIMKRWACSYCSGILPTRRMLRAHRVQCRMITAACSKKREPNMSTTILKSDEQNGTMQLKCDCGLHFFDTETFRQHNILCSQKANVTTRNMQVKIKCNACSSVFSSMNTFSVHLLECNDSQPPNIHLSKQSFIHYCKTCGHSYRDAMQFTKHPCRSLLHYMQSCVVVLDNIFPAVSKNKEQSKTLHTESCFSVEYFQERNQVQNLSCAMPLEVILEEKQDVFCPVTNTCIENPNKRSSCPTVIHLGHTNITNNPVKVVGKPPVVSVQPNITQPYLRGMEMQNNIRFQTSNPHVVHLQSRNSRCAYMQRKISNAIPSQKPAGQVGDPSILPVIRRQNTPEILKILLRNGENDHQTTRNLPELYKNNECPSSSNSGASSFLSSVDSMMECDGFVLGDKTRYICRRCYRSYQSESKLYTHNVEMHKFTGASMRIYKMQYAQDLL